MRFIQSIRISFPLLLASLCLGAMSIDAQVKPVNDYGAMGLAQTLRRINTTASVMMIGAHPDDEDSALLAYLARGENARTAYLSLTRGDGGQNIIGPELFESLGVIRTEELLQARSLDGAEQYFARAFDYGFSKTRAEAQQKWDEPIILCDVVRSIRSFQPQVVISRFSGTPADGHGQHQFAGYLSPKAIEAAADRNQCFQAGEPWTVLKFYVGQGFGPNSTATLRLNTGAYDPILGRSYFEVAMEGRSQHKSQGEGRLEYHGEIFSGLNLSRTAVRTGLVERSPFDGINVSIAGIAKTSGNMEEAIKVKLASLDRLVDNVEKKYRPADPQAILADLIHAASLASEAEGSTRQPDTIQLIRRTEKKIEVAIRSVVGLQIDALSSDETVVAGQKFKVDVRMFAAAKGSVEVKDITLAAPKGWNVEPVAEPGASGPGRRETADVSNAFYVTVAPDADSTQPYWLKVQRNGDLFTWPESDATTLPFQQREVSARVKCMIGGVEFTFDQPVQYRYVDATRGEIRRDLNVVPAVTVSMDQHLFIVPVSSKTQTREVVATVTNNSDGESKGLLMLQVPKGSGISVGPTNSNFELKRKGDKANVTFTLTIPEAVSTGKVSISALLNGNAASEMHEIAYPHIQTHRFYTAAESVVEILEIKTVPARIGYVMGSGDEVPEAIKRLGLDVKMLGETDLASGDLSMFDTIVVGIRATETRPDLVANSDRLLDYVRNGGNMIVQYQRGGFSQQNLLPFAATLGPRVVDENAKVTILEPQHPFFNVPNKITDADFQGWVQERNAYNFNTFDANYTPLLESHDAGEPLNKGGLVIANVGKGKYVYCSYSFFRQLPAGVPGAYRLFANLLALPRGK